MLMYINNNNHRGLTAPLKTDKMTTYTLDCNYYTKEFNSIDELINDITTSGMDPSYLILKNGVSIGEMAEDFLIF